MKPLPSPLQSEGENKKIAMKIYRYPEKNLWGEITSRPRLDLTKLNETVSTVLNDVRQRGDEAVKEYELKFDKAALQSLAVSEQEMQEAEQLVTPELKAAIELAHQNIHQFHAAQQFEGKKVETQPGVSCWQKSVAIERVYPWWHRPTLLYRADAGHAS